MNIWFAVAAVVTLMVLIALVVGTRRTRHIEDELNQPAGRPARTDTRASLTEGSPRALLRSLQAERKTGTLQLTAGGRSCSLYFLFGHLFHAASGTLTCEAVVLDCLDWHDVQSTFDEKATLPTEESIERPMDEILAGS